MSSRVQKGGQKFKPVVKPRGRPGEGIPGAARKPSSSRATTVDTFRSYSVLPNEERTQDLSRPPVPLASQLSVSERTLGPAVSSKPDDLVHDDRTKVPSSSRSTDEATHAIMGAVRDAETSSNSALNPTTAPIGAQDVNISREVPLVSRSHSHSQPIPVKRPSRAPSIVHRFTPAPSQITTGSGPTLHSLLRDMPSDVAGPEADRTHTQEEAGTWTLAGGRDSSPAAQKYPTTTDGTHSGLDIGDADASDALNGRMLRKRRVSKPRSVNEAAEVNAVVGYSSEQQPRRTKRARRSTTRQPEQQSQSDAVSTAEDSESDTQVQVQRKRRRRSTTTPSSTSTRGRHPRKSSLVFLDPDADPGEELDPTVVTMAAICDDTGQGRVSSKAALIQRNHLTWKAANKEKRERMRAAMEAKKYGRAEDEDRAQSEPSHAVKEASSEENESQAGGSTGIPTPEDANPSGFNYKDSLAANRFSAQVRIGANGETIVDEESLFVNRTDTADDGTDAYQHIEESEQTKFTNSASYGRKLRGSRWSAEETELFYDALSQFGENYELISYVLPGRDRKACKAKFKSEDKKNPNRITYCLNTRIPYDIQTLSRLTGKDFSGPPPEIAVPQLPDRIDQPKEDNPESEPEKLVHKPRKKSRTPAVSDDVEVLGDIGTIDADGPDE